MDDDYLGALSTGPQACYLPDASHAPVAPADHGEHEGGEGGEHEGAGPLDYLLGGVHYAHQGLEVATAGGTSAQSFAGMSEKLLHHITKAWSGEAGVGGEVGTAANGIAAPLSIAGGIMEFIGGINEWKEGHRGDGAFEMTKGGVEVGSGVATVAGMAGSEAGAALGPLGGALATGMAVGHYGDGSVKRRGWLHDDEGHAESASEWAGEKGRDVRDWAERHGMMPADANALGVATTLGSSIAGAGMAVGAAAADAGQGIGRGAKYVGRKTAEEFVRAEQGAAYVGKKALDYGLLGFL